MDVGCYNTNIIGSCSKHLLYVPLPFPRHYYHKVDSLPGPNPYLGWPWSFHWHTVLFQNNKQYQTESCCHGDVLQCLRCGIVFVLFFGLRIRKAVCLGTNGSGYSLLGWHIMRATHPGSHTPFPLLLHATQRSTLIVFCRFSANSYLKKTPC